MTWRLRRQRGSVTVLVAAMSLLLVAFVGLSVDGGEIQTQQRESQNAADGAALAAATAIINADNYGYTESDAATIAKTVAGYAGIPTGDVTMTFQDSSGADPNDPTKVVTVKADVTHTFPTLFLPVMDINSASVSAHAVVSVTQNTTANCGLCSLSSSASPAVIAQNGGQIKVNGGSLKVDSSASGALTVQGGGSVTATSVTSYGTAIGITNPTAVTGAAQQYTDPLASVPPPTLGSAATNVTYSSNTTISPGTYGSITVNSGVTLTMRPGVYVIAGGLTVNGTLDGSNAFFYFTCSSSGGSPVSQACASGQGNAITINGSMTVSAPAAGSDYTGLVMFADRNDNGTITVNGTITPTGTIYAESMQLYIPHGSHQSLTSRVVVGTVNVDNGGQLTINYTSSGNYVAPGKLSLTT